MDSPDRQNGCGHPEIKTSAARGEVYVDAAVSLAQIAVMSGRIWTPPDCNGFSKLWSKGHNC